MSVAEHPHQTENSIKFGNNVAFDQWRPFFHPNEVILDRSAMQGFNTKQNGKETLGTWILVLT